MILVILYLTFYCISTQSARKLGKQCMGKWLGQIWEASGKTSATNYWRQSPKVLYTTTDYKKLYCIKNTTGH